MPGDAASRASGALGPDGAPAPLSEQCAAAVLGEDWRTKLQMLMEVAGSTYVERRSGAVVTVSRARRPRRATVRRYAEGGVREASATARRLARIDLPELIARAGAHPGELRPVEIEEARTLVGLQMAPRADVDPVEALGLRPGTPGWTAAKALLDSPLSEEGGACGGGADRTDIAAAVSRYLGRESLLPGPVPPRPRADNPDDDEREGHRAADALAVKEKEGGKRPRR